MTNTPEAKRKTAKWLPALILALVLVGLLAWWFNSRADENSAVGPADAAASQDSTGVEMGQPAPPDVPVSSLTEGERGNSSAITNADALRTQPVPGADPAADGVPGVGPGAAPAPGQSPPAQGSN